LLLKKNDFYGALKFFQKTDRRCGGIYYRLVGMHVGICYMRMKEFEKAKKKFVALRKMAEREIQTIDNFLKFCDKR